MLINIQKMFKTYRMGENAVHALDGVSLTIGNGDFVAVMGASGSGKSTLLNILGCLDTPTSGTYLLDGVEVSRMSRAQLARIRNQKLGFVFQNFNLWPHMSILDNVIEAPRRVLGKSKAEAIEIAQREPWKRKQAIETAEARYNTSGILSILNWLTPPSARLIVINLQGMARMQVARTALAVERYRLATGQLPEDLSELVPSHLEEIPLDPFDGRPLRYKKRDGGYVVYSVGPDGTDDGGTERQPKRQGWKEDLPYDITFIVER